MATSKGTYRLSPPTLANGDQQDFLLNSTGALVVAATASGTGASADQVQGNVAHAVADAGNPVKIGAKYNSTLSAVSNGQRADGQSDQYGNLRVQLTATAGSGSDSVPNTSLSFASSNALNTTAGTLLAVSPYAFNGTSWDRTRKPNAFKRVASSSASGSPDFAKASAGDLMAFWGVNTQAALRYLHIYNKATAPVLGTDVPLLSYPIPASSAFSVTIPNGGAYFSTGIAYAFTTDIAGTPTTGAAAADITSFAMLVA